MRRANINPTERPSVLRVGIILAIFCLCAAPVVWAQQDEQVVSVSIFWGDVEISSKNQPDDSRLITVTLDDGNTERVLKQFKANAGSSIDILASYAASGGTYVVLRTEPGNGACAGAGGIYVLAFDETSLPPKVPLPVSVSPILEACLGDMPTVKFDSSTQAYIVISVGEYELRSDGYELSNSRWINTSRRRRRRSRHR
jgi:hypothetical protein